VVDDEPDVRELFNITLRMAGHVTETAKDGVEAVDRLQSDIPDLILLDLMMPRLDGFGLLTHIRQNMQTKPVRVLVATAKVLEEADNQKLNSWPVVGVLNKGELDIGAMVVIVSTALSKDPVKPGGVDGASAPPTPAEKLRESAALPAPEKKPEPAEQKQVSKPAATASPQADKQPQAAEAKPAGAPAPPKPAPEAGKPAGPPPPAATPGTEAKPAARPVSEPEKSGDKLMVSPPHALQKPSPSVPADQNGGSQKPEQK
jgi:CheY-like chemotaxis protein